VSLSLIIAMLCAFFVACDGKQGKSAYELAVEHGFEGSLEEWLDSLKGSDGQNGTDGKNGADGAVSIQEIYDKAVEEGFKGDYIEFLQSYLNLSEDVQTASNLALLSAVKVRAQGVIADRWGREQDSTSSGSGVIYKINKDNGDAYIITNYHVVYNTNYKTEDKICDDLDVFLYGYDEFEEQAIPVKYIGGAYDYDIAILKASGSNIIKNSDARAVDVASSKDVAVGSTAIAVGAPSSGGETYYNEIKFSVTKGVISVDSEELTISDSTIGLSYTTRVMRVDTAINSGNSGGGLFNAKGQLIGIVNAKASSTSIDNMGYAIPSDVAIGIADYAIANCDGEENKNIKKVYLGIGGVVNSSKAVYDTATKTVKVVEEILVSSIEEDSLASYYLQVGDILNAVEIDGVTYEITRSFSLTDALWRVKASTTSLKLYITRDSEDKVVVIPISLSDFVTLK
ncbi:MAG: S1C family serine protease, partial [Clostridia bacterium]|nr:S1C family serine protease [Clostridia bacterium]